MFTRVRLLSVLGVVGAALLLAGCPPPGVPKPPPAAITVWTSPGVLYVFSEGAGSNDLYVTELANGVWSVRDFRNTILVESLGFGCTLATANEAHCDPQAGYGAFQQLFVETGSSTYGNRVHVSGSIDTSIHGGPGVDVLVGGSKKNHISGHGGNDLVVSHGNAGPDTLDCGAGTDNVWADANDTVLNCEVFN